MSRCASLPTAWPSSASPKQPPHAAFIRKVVLYHAKACHLCARAREVVAQVRQEVSFELQEVEIDGDPDLESRYREWLPVVEIDGDRAFVYYVDPDAFRRKVAAQS